MSDASPTLAEFLPRYEKDDNEWWRLQSGDHQNLFEEAVDKWLTLRNLVQLYIDAHGKEQGSVIGHCFAAMKEAAYE